MKRVWESCVPRPEVLSGDLREESFAARLGQVAARRADPVYGDPDVFFGRTYPTEGLRTLLKEALGRLSGADPTAAPVLRLETGFGGGKTHNLIALYHAASGRAPAEALRRFVDGALVPAACRVAAVVGEDLNPAGGIPHPDGVTTFTLWGEIAYQLGGREAYQRIERADREAIPPGTRAWQELFGEEPALVLLDELAPYLRKLKQSQGFSQLADQVAPFLKELLEAVAASPRAVCVLTLAEASDAFGRETEELAQALTAIHTELRGISARMERTLSPTAGEEEIGQIVVHRLFEGVDGAAAGEAARAWREHLERLQAQGTDLPPPALQADYAALIERSYPLHPELLITLNRKTSTIPNFQRTRGALRLLARAIQRLWEQRPPDAWLIHLHHLDLSDPDIVEDLTSRLDRPLYKQVVEADIVSPAPKAPSHAETIDRRWKEDGRRPFAVKAATTIFLHSLTQQTAAGARTEEVNLAVLAPGDDPALLAQALSELERYCWHLEYEGERWRFAPEPSLNKMIADEVAYVGVTHAKKLVDDKLTAIWRPGTFDVRRFPSEPADVPDDAGRPKLAIIHYDAAQTREEEERRPELVRRLYEEAGTSGAARTFQNNVVFLVADAAQVERMVQAARTWKAIHRLLDDPERRRALTAEQQRRLRERADEAELALRLAIHRCYRFLYYPSADAPKEAAGLARETLPAREQGEVERDQSQVILEALKRLEKVYTADDRPIDPLFIKSRAWTVGRPAVGVAEIARAFAMRRGLRMLLEPRPLREGIVEGIRRGVWIYYDPAEGVGYGAASPSPLVNLESEAELLEPEEARARGIPIKGERAEPEHCPVCGKLAQECVCAPAPAPPAGAFRGEGTVEQALQQVADAMHDAGRKSLAALEVSVWGEGPEGARELKGLGLAVPQLGPGEFRIHIQATAEFGGSDALRLEFRGPWDLYRGVRDALEALLRRASRLDTRASVVCRFRDGCDLARLREIRQVLGRLDLGAVTVTAEPLEER